MHCGFLDYILEQIEGYYCNQVTRGLFTWHLAGWPNNWCWRKQVFIYKSPTWEGAAGSTPAQSPALPQDPALPLLPKRPEPCPEVPHILISSYAGYTNRAPSPLEMLLWGLESHPLDAALLQDLGCVDLSLHVVAQENMPCCTVSWWNPERHTSQESDFSVRPSEGPKSVARHSWSQFSSAPSISQESVLG